MTNLLIVRPVDLGFNLRNDRLHLIVNSLVQHLHNTQTKKENKLRDK